MTSITIPETISIELVVVSDFYPYLRNPILEALKESGKVYKVINHTIPNDINYKWTLPCFRVYALAEDVEEMKDICWRTERRNKITSWN